MSSDNNLFSAGGALKLPLDQFVYLVKQRDVSGVRALLQSMSSDEARRLFQATSKGFDGVFKPNNSVHLLCLPICCD